MKIFHVNWFVIKYSKKCDWFSVMIVETCKIPVEWLIQYLYDGHRLKWYTKLGKQFVLIYSLCFIDLGVVQLCLFVSLCKLLHMKTKGSVYCTNNTHADFRGEISEKNYNLYNFKCWYWFRHLNKLKYQSKQHLAPPPKKKHLKIKELTAAQFAAQLIFFAAQLTFIVLHNSPFLAAPCQNPCIESLFAKFFEQNFNPIQRKIVSVKVLEYSWAVKFLMQVHEISLKNQTKMAVNLESFWCFVLLLLYMQYHRFYSDPRHLVLEKSVQNRRNPNTTKINRFS